MIFNNLRVCRKQFCDYKSPDIQAQILNSIQSLQSDLKYYLYQIFLPDD